MIFKFNQILQKKNRVNNSFEPKIKKKSAHKKYLNRFQLIACIF